MNLIDPMACPCYTVNMITTQICLTCESEFTRTWAKKKPTPRYCSRACANKAPGRMTPEIRTKIGRKGVHHPNYKGGWVNISGHIIIGKILRSHTDDRPDNLSKMPNQNTHASFHQKGRPHSPSHILHQAESQKRNAAIKRRINSCE